ncbi:MAG: hypothetical protein C4K48_07145 [Candidatus Thorarchaeota archaeon]|nr:MAG: hypothetical protein C4K48_07145 [Candidatus Thorarchaeota archaeon]
MQQLLSILVFTLLIIIVSILSLGRSSFSLGPVWSSVKKAKRAPLSLTEFLSLRPSQRNRGVYYLFSEEQVRSFAHRFIGRLDGAVLHWDDVPILDALIEHKFPVNRLPSKMKPEDLFQAGLYSLALAESGVSCRLARLVTVYCLQDTAKQCLQDKLGRNCWNCGDARVFKRKFNPDEIRMHLKRLDEVWYNKRLPRASPSETKCTVCPFSTSGECNYSAV